MIIDLNVIATGLAAPVAVLLVKTLLDFSLARVFVKWCWWIPVRGFFRDKPPNIAGDWEHIWGAAGSESFGKDTDRHSHTTIRQLGQYCYGEFVAKGVRYALFGVIRNYYLVGEWYEIKDKKAYFGSFQLRIIDGKAMSGKYLGHSRTKCIVQQDDWSWTRNA